MNDILGNELAVDDTVVYHTGSDKKQLAVSTVKKFTDNMVGIAFEGYQIFRYPYNVVKVIV